MCYNNNSALILSMNQNSSGSQKFIALTYPDFRLLWIGLLISNIGSQMQLVAINWHVYIITNSAISLGLVGFFRFVPIVFFSLIGGTFADAHNRKQIMLISQIVLTVFSGILALTSFMGIVNPYIIYSITVANAIAMSFDMPARQALIPQLVDRKHLTNALSINTIMFQASTITGPAIAGFAIAQFGVESIYALNTFSFLAVILALLLMKTSGSPLGGVSKVSFHSMKEGISFVKSKTIIWSTMLLDFFSTFFSSATALLPIFAKDILSVGPQGLGFLYAAPAVGSLLAGFIMAHFGQVRKQGKILLYAFVVYALATILFGFSKIYWLSLLALGIVGLSDGISMIIRNTIRHLTTPDYIRGRMSSITMIFFMGGPQLGEFEAGIIAALLGAPFSVVSGGIATLLVIGLIAKTIPAIRNYDSHEKESE